MSPWPCVPEVPCSLREQSGAVFGGPSLLTRGQPCNEGEEPANEADEPANEGTWAEVMKVLSGPSL